MSKSILGGSWLADCWYPVIEGLAKTTTKQMHTNSEPNLQLIQWKSTNNNSKPKTTVFLKIELKQTSKNILHTPTRLTTDQVIEYTCDYGEQMSKPLGTIENHGNTEITETVVFIKCCDFGKMPCF